MFSTMKHYAIELALSPSVGRGLQKVTRGHIRSRGARYNVADWEPRLAAAIAFGLYERPEVLFSRKYLATSMRVLELGGSRGVVSSSILQLLPPAARLVSVEANPRLIEELQRNLTRNANGHAVEVRHLAVGEGDKLLLDTSRGSLASSLSSVKGVEVPMTTLEGLVDDLKWEDFSLISDIEGAEVGFVLGDDPGLLRCRKLVLEMHCTTWQGQDVTPGDLIAELTGRHEFRLMARHNNVGAFVRV
jgi:FkbM family methyltransferase